MKRALSLILLCSVALTGCASIVNGRSEDVSINTSPSEADCYVGGTKYRSPAKASLKRKNDYDVKCEKEGYSPATAQIKSKTSGWVWGNIAFGGIIGLVVDVGTGGAYKLRPNELSLALAPLPGGYVSSARPAAVATAATMAVVNYISDIDDLPEVPLQIKPRAHAVVIGIENYRGKIPPVKYAERDARTAAAYVRKVFGYQDENIAVLINNEASKSDFEKYFEKWLPNRVEKGDEVIVYFAGHGAPAADTGKAYLVPFDGDPEYLSQTAYPVDKLYENLSKLPASKVTIVMDSCFSGGGGRSIVAENARPLMQVKLEKVPTNIVLLAAAAKDQISLAYDEVGHGMFTYYFLRSVKDQSRDGVVDMRTAFVSAAPLVSRTARRKYNADQTPQYTGSK